MNKKLKHFLSNYENMHKYTIKSFLFYFVHRSDKTMKAIKKNAMKSRIEKRRIMLVDFLAF